MAEDSYHITTIMGDLLEWYFTVSNPDMEMIDKVRFTCPGEGIYAFLPYSDKYEGYCLRFDQSVTGLFRAGTFFYDITAILTDGSERTLIYQGLLTVKPKIHPIYECNCTDEEEEEDDV